MTQLNATAQSDYDLTQAIGRGGVSKIGDLYERHKPLVYSICLRMTGNTSEAEDLTQEIFVKVFRALPTFDRRASFETWLTKVCRNLCIDRYRRRRREEERFTDEVDPDTIQIDELVSRPDATLEQRDEIAMVRRALAKLDPTYREAVALRDVHDLSYEEIARRLQLPEGTVKSRISRGRKELARHLRLLQEHARASAASKRSGERQEASYAKN